MTLMRTRDLKKMDFCEWVKEVAALCLVFVFMQLWGTLELFLYDASIGHERLSS